MNDVYRLNVLFCTFAIGSHAMEPNQREIILVRDTPPLLSSSSYHSDPASGYLPEDIAPRVLVRCTPIQETPISTQSPCDDNQDIDEAIALRFLAQQRVSGGLGRRIYAPIPESPIIARSPRDGNDGDLENDINAAPQASHPTFASIGTETTTDAAARQVQTMPQSALNIENI